MAFGEVDATGGLAAGVEAVLFEEGDYQGDVRESTLGECRIGFALVARRRCFCGSAGGGLRCRWLESMLGEDIEHKVEIGFVVTLV